MRPSAKGGKRKRSDQIIEDAETVYNFLVDVYSYEKEDIIISGRSIGSGPAIHLARKFNPSCLLLISPIKGVNHIAT